MYVRTLANLSEFIAASRKYILEFLASGRRGQVRVVYQTRSKWVVWQLQMEHAPNTGLSPIIKKTLQNPFAGPHKLLGLRLNYLETSWEI
jgi:hypothetical protein